MHVPVLCLPSLSTDWKSIGKFERSLEGRVLRTKGADASLRPSQSLRACYPAPCVVPWVESKAGYGWDALLGMTPSTSSCLMFKACSSGSKPRVA